MDPTTPSKTPSDKAASAEEQDQDKHSLEAAPDVEPESALCRNLPGSDLETEELATERQLADYRFVQDSHLDRATELEKQVRAISAERNRLLNIINAYGVEDAALTHPNKQHAATQREGPVLSITAPLLPDHFEDWV